MALDNRSGASEYVNRFMKRFKGILRRCWTPNKALDAPEGSLELAAQSVGVAWSTEQPKALLAGLAHTKPGGNS